MSRWLSPTDKLVFHYIHVDYRSCSSQFNSACLIFWQQYELHKSSKVLCWVLTLLMVINSQETHDSDLLIAGEEITRELVQLDGCLRCCQTGNIRLFSLVKRHKRRWLLAQKDSRTPHWCPRVTLSVERMHHFVIRAKTNRLINRLINNQHKLLSWKIG